MTIKQTSKTFLKREKKEKKERKNRMLYVIIISNSYDLKLC